MSEQQAEDRATITAERVAALLAAYEAGEISEIAFRRAVSVAVFAGKVVATRLADITVSTLANLPPLGIVPSQNHLDRLDAAVSTILEEPEQVPERLARLAVAETLCSHRRSLHAAIREHGFPQWRRIVQPDACELCEPLRNEISQISRKFRDHPGCKCSLMPYGERISHTPSPVPASASRITFTNSTRQIA